MKPDKETFEAIIADLEMTMSDPTLVSHRRGSSEDRELPLYNIGWEAGFKDAIRQIKRRKKLFIGGDAASEETS